jgi:serine/threonine-protein kinase
MLDRFAAPPALQHLLFAIVARQMSILDARQFTEACGVWAQRQGAPLVEYLLQRGWIDADKQAQVERMLQARLAEAKGDAATCLTTAIDSEIYHVLSNLPEPTVKRLSNHLRRELAPAKSAASTKGRYELARLYAVGGIGQVWLARDSDLGREVALKELRAEQRTNPRARARFVQEARVTGQLEHPSIVPVYELVDPKDGREPFYVMRFVQGRTLGQAARDYHARREKGEASRFELLALLDALIAACHAIGYAHSRGVIHRDLKGDNIVLGNFGEVMVLDWGLAKVVGAASESALDIEEDQKLTEPGQVLGTPSYMAPEQAKGTPERVGPPADIYGLGAVLYQVLTGKAPFSGANAVEVIFKVVQEAPERPRKLNPDVAPALEAICLKAMAKKIESRYESAEELAKDLQRWRADEPVLAYREPAGTRLSRWSRRRRPLARAAVLLLAVVTGGLAAALARLAHERARTESARNEAIASAEEANRLRREAEANAAAADNQRKIAEQNLSSARQAVDTFFTLSESRLRHKPGLQPLRRELLRAALDHYKEFARQKGADPEIQAELGRAHARLASIYMELGDRAQALEHYRNAVAIQEALLAKQPKNAALRRDLALALTGLGSFHQGAGSFDYARDAYQKALAQCEQLDRDSPGNSDYQSELAAAHNNFGAICDAMGESAKAEAEYRQAQDIFVRLTRKESKNPDYRQGLASTYQNLGTLHESAGKLDQARDEYEKSRGELLGLVRDFPEVPDYQNGLATIHGALGAIHRDLRPPDKAEAEFKKALPLREKLARDYPESPDYQAALARVLGDLGILHASAKSVDAEKELERAVSILDKLVGAHPSVAEYRASLATTRGNLGLVLRTNGKTAPAEDALRKAQGGWQKLTRENSKAIEYQLGLAGSEANLAALFRDTNRTSTALDGFSKAITQLEPLLKQERYQAEAKRHLLFALRGRAETYNLTGKLSDAEKDWQRGLQLEPGPLKDTFKLGLAGTFARQGKLRRAITDAEAILASMPPGYLLIQAAGVYAQASATAQNDQSLKPPARKKLADKYAGQAVDLLVKAYSQGAIRTPGRLEALKDLDPIRKDPRYVQLVEQIKKAAGGK